MDADPLTTALPAGARLLHIGIPKTGTTALQTAAAAARPLLLEQGVLYPGRAVNHLQPVCALMGRPFGWTRTGTAVAPPMVRWTELMAEVERHAGSRVLISHEFAAESTDEQARRFVEELGPSTHVAVTLRSFAALLGSSWQQYVKAGRRLSFGGWLRHVLADEPTSRSARLFYRRNDQAVIVRRWRDLVGPDRVIVVIPDKTRPEFVLDAFAALLGVPGELLRPGSAVVGGGENRSMSWPEVEYLRQLNRAVRDRLDWRQYEIWIRNGAVARMLTARRPRSEEPHLVLPPWAAERAQRIAAGYAAAVEASGVRVIGDLDALAAPAAVGTLKRVRAVPMDAAAAAAAGLVSAGLGQGSHFDVTDRPLPPVARRIAASDRGRRVLELNESVPTAKASELFAVGVLRAARQLRHRLQR